VKYSPWLQLPALAGTLRVGIGEEKMISPGFIAELLGAAFAMALTGALVAWLLRKVTGIGLVTSYALGITVVTFAGAALYVSSQDGSVDYLSAWIKYAMGGVVGFVILYATSRRSVSKA